MSKLTASHPLLIDVGNSRIKCATWSGGELAQYQVFEHGSDFNEAWYCYEGSSRVIACNVAGPALGARVSEWCDKNGLALTWVTSTDDISALYHCYEKPKTLGDDRWLAMAGARSLYAGSVCVIDCGTATTVDVVDANGNHKGGAILPGVNTMRAALHQNTHGLPDANAEVSVFSNNTENAITGGTAYALAAAIDRFVSEAKSQFGTELQSVVGGGEALLISPLLQQKCTVNTKLVLLGLAVAAGVT